MGVKIWSASATVLVQESKSHQKLSAMATGRWYAHSAFYMYDRTLSLVSHGMF